MILDELFEVSERAKAGSKLSTGDKDFLLRRVPEAMSDFHGSLPKRVRHPGGFSVSGAPVSTFARSALLVAARRAFGERYDKKSSFYEGIEKDFAFGVMRSHFHNGHPKGAFCCGPCTLAVVPVLRVGAIRWFDCKPLLANVERVIRKKEWRFGGSINPRIVEWALG